MSQCHDMTLFTSDSTNPDQILTQSKPQAMIASHSCPCRQQLATFDNNKKLILKLVFFRISTQVIDVYCQLCEHLMSLQRKSKILN